MIGNGVQFCLNFVLMLLCHRLSDQGLRACSHSRWPLWCQWLRERSVEEVVLLTSLVHGRPYSASGTRYMCITSGDVLVPSAALRGQSSAVGLLLLLGSFLKRHYSAWPLTPTAQLHNLYPSEYMRIRPCCVHTTEASAPER